MDHTLKKSTEKLTGIGRELATYAAEPSKNISPIDYWKQHMNVYTGLFIYYKKILCIQGSSVPLECLFSHTRYTIWDCRNKLSPDRVNKLMVIYEYN